MRIRPQFQTLTMQIIVLVLAILALITLVLGLIAYQVTRERLETAAISNLSALAAARQTALQLELEDYMTMTASFAQPDLAAEASTLLAAGEAERDTLQPALNAAMRREFPAHLYLERARIADLSGTVIATTAVGQEGMKVSDSPAFTHGQIRPYISDPFLEGGAFYIETSFPLADAQGNTIAVLLLRFDGSELLTITGDYTGLGETGETVLGTRHGDEIYFLTPLRFNPDLSTIAPAPAGGQHAAAMIHATSGQSGVTRSPDYRGMPVIAAYRHIEPTGWGVVVKQDRDEIFAGIFRLRSNLLIGMALALLAASVIVIPLARTFTRPLRDLEAATRQVAGGDLSIRVPVSQLDEVGRLAEAFNSMVGRLRESRDELAQSNQELASFAHVVSHDLKAPLRGIASLSEWLEEGLGPKLQAGEAEQMRLLRERVRRMEALINGLLDYARVGRLQDLSVRVEVGGLLARVIDTIDPPEGIQVTVVPPMPTLTTDELHLSQVFQNLIDNAVRYHPGPEGHVEVSCQEADPFWEFAIRDDGIGIEPRYHDRIFQMFQSLHAVKDPDSTGIGLALAKKIVEQRGGKIWVESQGIAGQGSTFCFTWPKNE